MSTLSEVERVVFFPSSGSLVAESEESGSDPSRREWRTPIRARVFDAKEHSLKRRVGLLVLRKTLGLDREEARTAIFLRRARAFLAEDSSGVELSLRLGSGYLRLSASGRDGHVLDHVRLPDRFVAPARDGSPVDLPCIERPSVVCPVWLLASEGVSVVTDIDDTIKVSEVAQRRQLLRNTFLREYASVDGMPDLYRQWSIAGASFHYVSNTPWQLYDSLSEFLRRDGFPSGEFRLRRFRWRDNTFLDFFRSPEEHKIAALEQLFEAFPRRRFVLVGDTGERDPEVYGRCARERPGQVARVLLRRVEGASFDTARAERCFARVPADVWRVFERADEVTDALPPL